MAEIIERHLESMINEIEEMKRVKLFTNEETKDIIRKRKEFEYKVNGRVKNLKDYQNYIQYEIGLITQIRNRRDKLKIGEKKRVIEYRILQRIKRLYELSIQRYATDFPLRLTYFKFCKEYKFITPASRAVENMLKHFSHLPEVWIIGASWFSKERTDLNRALGIVHKGLTLHKHNQILYKEAIKLELMRVDNGDDSKEQNKLKEKINKKISVYVNVILQSLKDYNFFIEIVELLENHAFTEDIQNMIIKNLINEYSERALVWHVLAQRDYRGLHYSLEIEEEETTKNTNFESALNKYRTGLLKVSGDEKKVLWQKYLDFLFEIRWNKEASEEVITLLLKELLNEASSESGLSEELYVKWLELASNDKALEILEKGTRSLPKSENLWKLRLQFALMTNNEFSKDIFEEAIIALQENALKIWLVYIESNKTSNDVMDQLYQRGVNESPQVSNILKVHYIEWVAEIKNMNEARKLYNTLRDKKPFSKELHTFMLSLELKQSKIDLPFCINIFNIMINQFGEEDVNVWINYILLHMNHNNADDVNEIVQNLYREAEVKLGMPLAIEFREKYNDVLSGEINNFI